MKRNVLVHKMLPVYIVVLIGCILISFFGSSAVTVMVENAPFPDRNCIIIDAGHGGIDGGATSCTGVPESQLNLQIAMRLNDLMKLLGHRTYMIRTTDTSMHTEGHTIAAQKVSDLKQRVKIVNETKNALLISIHQNTFPDAQYSGAQVFYGKSKQSLPLAQNLQAAFVETINPGSKRKCKASDGIYLMQNIQCAGVLIECGFLTNPNEEALLRSEEYQKKICCVIASGASIFLNAELL